MQLITLVELELEAFKGGSLPAFPGAESRAAFLALLNAADPQVASDLHAGREGRSVYAIKPLRFKTGYTHIKTSKTGLGSILYTPGARAELKVAIMDDELSRKAVLAVASKPSQLTVGETPFALTAISVSVIDPKQILDSGSENTSEADLHFQTPTYFNPINGDQKYKILYPEPTHLLASLIATAHSLTGRSYEKPQTLADKVFISGLSIRTPPIQAQNPAPNGFTGWAKLRFKPEAQPSDKKTITGLLKLGELTNIGGNRSAGYGVLQVKI
ncbi:MAG: CRISPR system precrRNA processing endoribonuclease RAMP protein Cas6 [Infirmifilum sp.]